MGTRTRRRLVGEHALLAALASDETVRRVLVRSGSDAQTSEAVTAARAAGVPVRLSSDGVMRRFAPSGERFDVLAVAGPRPAADLPGLMAGDGAVWLLAGLRYPGNVGFAIRTAEVAGAAGVVVAGELESGGRRRALRASMRADWFLPVLFQPWEDALDAARTADRRVVVVEDDGACAPWETDLTGRVLFVVGGEREGVPRGLRDAADVRLRIPMAGFIPAYNVQAALAMVAGERLRQAANQA